MKLLHFLKKPSSLLFIFVSLVLTPLPVQADFYRTKIAVLDFELIGDKLETAGMGAILSEWLTTSIVQTGRFDVVERAMLQKVLGEQKLANSGIIDEQSASELGKILGVEVIISGSIAKLGQTVEVNARLISVESGSIIAAERSQSNKGIDNLHSLVEQLTFKIMQNFPLTGYIVKKDADSVLVDLGLRSGLALGTEFIVYKEGEVIKHPKTGEVLDVEQILTGKIKITKISRNVAQGRVLSEQRGGIAYGQQVKSINKSNAKEAAKTEAPKPPIAQTKPAQHSAPAAKPAPPKKEIIRFQPESKKNVISQSPDFTQNERDRLATPSAPSTSEKRNPGVYKVAIFPWIFHREADTFKAVLLDRIQYQINDISKAELAASYYKIKKIPQLRMNERISSLYHGVSPNVELLQEKGRELGVDVAVVGQMNIHCRWSDNCQVRNIDFHIVDLLTGRVYTESGYSWKSEARDYIESTARKVFASFAAGTK